MYRNKICRYIVLVSMNNYRINYKLMLSVHNLFIILLHYIMLE